MRPVSASAGQRVREPVAPDTRSDAETVNTTVSKPGGFATLPKQVANRELAELRQSPPGAELAELIADPTLAALLLRLLVHDVTERARRDGVVATPKCRRLLRLLHAAAEKGLHSVDIPEVADDGHDHEPAGMIEDVTGMVPVVQLAELSGFPCRTLRRWAAVGRVRAHRVGRVWLIDPESLKRGAS